MAINIRTKGQNGEREAASFLNITLGKSVEHKRALGQAREGGADVISIEGLSIEVKRHETLNVNQWWKQVERAADNAGTVPVLMYRQNRKRWQFCIPAYLLVLGAPGYLTLQEDAFQVWLRHWAGSKAS